MLQSSCKCKEGTTAENLRSKIKQVVYSLYRAKEITKKAYNNIMKSVKVWYKNEYYIYEF